MLPLQQAPGRGAGHAHRDHAARHQDAVAERGDAGPLDGGVRDGHQRGERRGDALHRGGRDGLRERRGGVRDERGGGDGVLPQRGSRERGVPVLQVRGPGVDGVPRAGDRAEGQREADAAGRR